jgi:hypothetical protein
MSITRRMVLRSAAASLFLPLLPSALPRSAWGQEAGPPRRLLFWFSPNGLLVDSFKPQSLGAGYDLPFVLEPIAALQDRVSVLSGLQNDAAASGTFGTHEACTASLLTDATIEAFGADLAAGQSVDQLIAGTLGGQTPFPSMQLASGEPFIEGIGNTSIYYSTISWASQSTPLANLTSPRVLFDRMFGGSDPALTEEERAKRLELRTSVLDVVLERSNQLASRLSAADRAKLDQYQTGVRELEGRIQQLDDLQCEQPPEPGNNPGYAETVSLMSDLMAVAFECDMTRVITWMSGYSTSETVYDFLGVTTSHHNLSHDWAYSNSAKQDLLKVQQWQVQMYTGLLERLAAKPDGQGGDLLSHTAVVLCSEFGDSNMHVAEPVPFLLAGGEAAGWAQGQHRAAGGAPHSNLMRTLSDFMGVDATAWAQTSTGTLDLS